MPKEAFVSEAEFRVLDAFATLANENPFETERVAAEQAALGEAFENYGGVWHVDASLDGINPNLNRLIDVSAQFAEVLRNRLADGARAREVELATYEALINYVLFERYQDELYALIEGESEGQAGTQRLACYDAYKRDFEHFFHLPDVRFPMGYSAPHLFAIGYQIRRAFHHTYRQISGGSMRAARLRAAVWESVFTSDTARYRRALYDRMGDFPTLITGESGTGKELVARAIGLSRYIPFDEKKRGFVAAAEPNFHPVNLSALPSALIESELFGHRRGSFTGAVEDRTGWLESCHALGTIFLDEIGELDESIQVKLLRVLQSRAFQRVGETDARRFEGKIVAATNRDLAHEIESGRFRGDFYYRLCSDVIQTPSLAEQIQDSPEELDNMVLVLARRVVGTDEAEILAGEVVDWVHEHLPADYAWPGNVRELEQCLRNVLVRGTYTPLRRSEAKPATDLPDPSLSADELLRIHCTHVYFKTGSYEAAAKSLGLDRRTVKARIDPALLEELKGES